MTETKSPGASPRAPFLGWTDQRLRALLYQVLILAAVIGALWWLVGNTRENLARQNIASGFSFLGDPAGFSIIMHLIPYDEGSSYGRAFLVGLTNTLVLSALGVVLATLVGFVIGIARLSSNWLVSRLAGAYVEILRNVPLLLQLFFWYFVVLRALPSPRASLTWGEGIFLNLRGLYLPAPVFGDGIGIFALATVAALGGAVAIGRWAGRLREARGTIPHAVWPALGLVLALPFAAAWATGFPLSWDFPRAGRFNVTGGVVLIPEFVALLLALSIYTAAFVAEIVRAGILAVDQGQTEAARSLGLSPGRTLRLVVVPQAMRVIVPPLTSQYLNLVKNSSLAAAIAYPDLVSVFAGTVLNQSGQAIEVIALTMAVYLTLSLAISFAMNLYNARMARKGL